MTLAQKASVLMKSADDTKLESSTSTDESWDSTYEKKMGNFEDKWRKVEIQWDERGSLILQTNNSFCYEVDRKSAQVENVQE